MYFTFKEGKSYSANTVNQGERGEGGGRRNVSLVRVPLGDRSPKLSRRKISSMVTKIKSRIKTRVERAW